MRTWTTKEENKLKREYSSCADPRELADKLGKTYEAIRSKALKMGLKRKASSNTGRTTCSPKDERFIRKNYLTMPIKRMADEIGRSQILVRCRMRQLGLIVPKELAEQFKTQYQFKAGREPGNKGKKWSEFMSKKGQKASRKTQFKKGNLPFNTKSDFEISVREDKRGIKYKFIRIGLSNWIPLHRYNWEKVNGKIPAKMNLVFKDGDTLNCKIDNLEALTDAELMQRNTYHNYPKPIAQAIQLRGALNRQINKHLKKYEKQNQ